MTTVFIDSFTTLDDLKGKNRTYENIKAAVLKAGKFSCFDIVTHKDAKIFTELCNLDPEIEIDKINFQYPWTGVRLKEKRE